MAAQVIAMASLLYQSRPRMEGMGTEGFAIPGMPISIAVTVSRRRSDGLTWRSDPTNDLNGKTTAAA